jgi:hypothetical protein
MWLGGWGAVPLNLGKDITDLVQSTVIGGRRGTEAVPSGLELWRTRSLACDASRADDGCDSTYGEILGSRFYGDQGLEETLEGTYVHRENIESSEVRCPRLAKSAGVTGVE